MSTIIQQGRFTSDGSVKNLAIRSDVDWMEVINYTQAATTQSTGRGVKFYWQRGMANGTGIKIGKENSSSIINMDDLTSGGFTLLDTADLTPGAAQTGTTITKAAPAVCTVTTHPFSTGDIVRIYNSDTMDQINGLEFTVANTGANTFTLANLNTNIANFTAATSFNARKIPFDPQFYPRNRTILNISQATSAIVTMSVTHGFTVGQLVSFRVPSAFGMVQLDGLQGTVTAINQADANSFTNTITVDIDTSAFSAFGFPAASAAPLNFAQVIPVGVSAGNTYGGLLDDASDNVSILGMQLAAGVNSPAGSSSDVIYWRAGKSFAVDNA